MSREVGLPKANRTVGIFYFNWQASFGNTEVYDIAEGLKANPDKPAWGPVQAPHYLSEPRMGYHRPDYPWVIRKHVQLLCDAGVDVLILDATNGFTYDAEPEARCVVLEQMKAEGKRQTRPNATRANVSTSKSNGIMPCRSATAVIDDGGSTVLRLVWYPGPRHVQTVGAGAKISAGDSPHAFTRHPHPHA